MFEGGTGGALEIPAVAVEPLPETFESLGFDVVSRSAGTSFECSPLSCCDMAQEMGANPFCLLPTLPVAIPAAVRFSTEQPEPGPYLVLEVLRETERPWLAPSTMPRSRGSGRASAVFPSSNPPE